MASESAWVRLCRLGGLNYRMRVHRKGHSVYVGDPQRPDKAYRLDARGFDAGEVQVRRSWAISLWGTEAEIRTNAEANWQT